MARGPSSDVPGHDQRDLDFARKYNLDVIPVVAPKEADPDQFEIGDFAYLEDGIHVNSDFLDGLSITDAKEIVATRLEDADIGTREVNYRLRDWVYLGNDIGVAPSRL